MTTQYVYETPLNTIRSFLGWMIFVARSRGPKKRSGVGRQSAEVDIRRLAKIFIQWN